MKLSIIISALHARAERLSVKRACRLCFMLMLLEGCTPRGGASFTLFGAYFPAWMFCALIGLLGAIGARVVFVATGLSNALPLQLFVCIAVGVIIACLAWLNWFGPAG